MGILKSKKKRQIDEASERVQVFFDEYFREELKKRGREYFEKVIDENSELFRKNLDDTITQVYTELKNHLTMELDEQFAEYGKSMKATQDQSLKLMERTSKELEQQYQQLGVKLKKDISSHDEILTKTFEENMIQITAMKNAQYDAVKSLEETVKSIQEQQEQLGHLLQQRVAYQETVLVGAFEQNMARVIEHYLLGALGDQYDMKAQLPSIIKQMEANKQELMDDIKL